MCLFQYVAPSVPLSPSPVAAVDVRVNDVPIHIPTQPIQQTVPFQQSPVVIPIQQPLRSPDVSYTNFIPESPQYQPSVC